MMKKIISFMLLLLLAVPAMAADKGFDQYGYNYTARNFVGTYTSWAMSKYGWTYDQAQTNLGAWANDKLVMKWNAEWDRGNAENWSKGPYKAWTSNEWNGRANGSGEVWYYKIVWVGDYSTNADLIPDGAYGIWGQFAVVMDNGSNADRVHTLMHSSPGGYGAF